MKRLLAILLAAAMLIGVLAGCSKKNEGAQEDGDNKPAVVKPQSNEEKAAATAKYVYTADYLDIAGDFDYINAIAGGEDYLYFSASIKDGSRTETSYYVDEDGNPQEQTYTYDVYVPAIFQMELSSGAVRRMDGYVFDGDEEGWFTDGNAETMKVAEDGSLWAMTTRYSWRYDLPEDFDPANDEQWNYYEEGENQLLMDHLGVDGELIERVDLSILNDEIEDGRFYASGFETDSKGNIFISDWQHMFVLSPEGKVLQKVDTSENGGSIMKYTEDEIGCYFYNYDQTTDKSSQCFRALDPVTGQWGPDKPIPTNGYNYFPGNEEYTLFYSFNGNIYGWKAEDDSSEKIVDWMEADINPNEVYNYTILPDGRVLTLQQNYDETTYEVSYTLVTLSRADPSTVKEKTALTLACFGLDWNLSSRIVDFNRSSDTYRIVVRDYSEYATDEDYRAGLTKLNTEIMSGQIPDMFLTNNLPVSRYAGKGVLADLYELIDADSELSRDYFVPSILSALETDGKLYMIPVSFGINTAVGLTKVVGEYDTWTVADVQDAMSKLQNGATVMDQYTDRASIFSYCMSRSIADLVNWQTGECYFDSPDFIDILKFANQFPNEIDWESIDWENYEEDRVRIKEGRQLLRQIYLYGVSDLGYNILDLGDVTFVGFPTASGRNTSAFTVQTGLAISSTCADRDAAWGFMRQLLTEDYQSQSVWNIPVCKACLDRVIKEMGEITYVTDENGEPWLDEDGEPVKQSKGGWWDEEAQEYHEIYVYEPEIIQAIEDLINNTTSIYTYDEDIMTIVMEEVQAFFAGQKSAEDVAKLIQSRVRLYVAEQS